MSTSSDSVETTGATVEEARLAREALADVVWDLVAATMNESVSHT